MSVEFDGEDEDIALPDSMGSMQSDFSGSSSIGMCVCMFAKIAYFQSNGLNSFDFFLFRSSFYSFRVLLE